MGFRGPAAAFIVILASTLAGRAVAQLVPPPVTSEVVNFDDVIPAPSSFDQTLPLEPPTYSDLGVTFSGFGQNGAAILDQSSSFGADATTMPNFLAFNGIAQMENGGFAEGPEFLNFYPAVQSLQFDSFSVGFCGTETMLIVSAFDANGNSLGTTNEQLVASTPTTYQLTFPPPGAALVSIVSNRECGPFSGVDIFVLDTVAFEPVPAAASGCASDQMNAARAKAKAEARCVAKAVLQGKPVDSKCIASADKAFMKAFASASSHDKDCLTSDDGPTIEGAVDAFVSNLTNTVTGGSPGPDICESRKINAAGRNASDVGRCYARAAKGGLSPDAACVTATGKALTPALKNCATASDVSALESLVDAFVRSLTRDLTVPTTTTTTTTTTSTSTTTIPPLGQHLAFTTTLGSDCTGDAPFSGTVFSDTTETTPIESLGLSCLFIGGGNSSLPASVVPDGATSDLDSPDGTTLVASFGTGPNDCTRGPNATRHCVNDPGTSCTSDSQCAGAAGGCAFDSNCFFGPPVQVNGFPTTCVVNTFAADASGSVDLATGSSTVDIPLGSRVYIGACPLCSGGACDSGANAGGPCTTPTSTMTSTDCIPPSGAFVGQIAVDLNPLTTNTTGITAADGNFCPGQHHPGAFGQPTAEAVQQVGSPAGDLTDGNPHASILGSNFCIPATGSVAIDTVGDLPGPGSVSLNGTAQFFAAP